MAFFNSSSPAYKKAASPNATAYAPSASSSLANMLGSLLGGSAPVYKTVGGQAPREQSSSGLLRIFIGSQPSYRTASPMSQELTDEDLADAEMAEIGDDADTDEVCPPPIDTVVLL